MELSVVGSDFEMKKAFTLIELLVVIGIIAVLSGIMVVSVGRTSESARAAKCLANLRNLSQGANSIAMASGIYPLASSIQRPMAGTTGLAFFETKGWISWLSKGDPFGVRSGIPAKSIVKCQLPRFKGFDNEDDNLFVLTNGTMWLAVNKTRDVYLCPTHSQAFQKHNGSKRPLYSYVMNGYFGYDYTEGTKSVGGDMIKEYGQLEHSERLLMFAEIPMINPEDGSYMEPSEPSEQDGVLQVKATVNGETYGKMWNGVSESIGFNHKNGKKGYCAHVAFADGHVETFAYGVGTGLKDTELTALLCYRKEVVFDGKGYREIEEND